VEIGVPRQRLPDAKANEFYWADLIGLRVVNTQNHEFGRVVRMVETGANDVLVVADQTGNGRETLIPFIADAVKKIDIAAGIVEVDWGEDY
jgi:16S rRNA processing protein RimM